MRTQLALRWLARRISSASLYLDGLADALYRLSEPTTQDQNQNHIAAIWSKIIAETATQARQDLLPYSVHLPSRHRMPSIETAQYKET